MIFYNIIECVYRLARIFYTCCTFVVFCIFLQQDLCDRLYEICDNRKEMAENERTLVMKEGWLQDRLGLLTNHYLTLMQVEVDRYQDTYRVLKDYYNSAEGTITCYPSLLAGLPLMLSYNYILYHYYPTHS